VGCPIRRSRDPRVLASPPSFSQRATSFIASRCQGIHQMPFSLSSPTPSPKRALARAPRTDDRGQKTDKDADDRPRCPPAERCATCPQRPSMVFRSRRDDLPRRTLHTHAQTRARRPHFGPPWLAPASRSRLASRCQRSEGGEQRSDRRSTTHRRTRLEFPGSDHVVRNGA
jgi:hypothetical protein